MPLPDVLEPKLKVVFCGTAVGRRSWRLRLWYAVPRNQFWKVLYSVGLTPRLLTPEEYAELPAFGVGLTDLARRGVGPDRVIRRRYFRVDALEQKIRRFAPQALAFNGKLAAKIFLDCRHVDYGRHTQSIGVTSIFVLPSTSGAARGFWDDAYWFELAEFVA